MKIGDVPSGEGVWAAGKQFFRRNPGGFQGSIAPPSGQKARRLGMWMIFKQALTLLPYPAPLLQVPEHLHRALALGQENHGGDDVGLTAGRLAEGGPAVRDGRGVHLTRLADAPGGEAELSTVELKEVLGDDISLAEPEIFAWIQNYLSEQEAQLEGAVQER